ncbi:MAG: acyl-CoA thioesterase II, partial [Dokdonella sp.]
VYNVERTRDGHSFSARRVVAIQHGQMIFNMTASFHVPETGAQHQLPMPLVPQPEDLPPYNIVPPEDLDKIPAMRRRWLSSEGPFEFRHVHPRNELHPIKQPPAQNVWFRLVSKAPDNDVLHRSLLAYASDFHLIGTTTFPHAISYLQPNVRMASLDHALWFHRPFRADDWLLYSCDSPSAQDSRGLARGMIYSRDGRLVASTAQEGLIRVVDDSH